MENAFSYALGPESAMQGGDSRYSRLAQAQLFKEANPDMELEVKTKKVTDKVSETLNVIANEPSLAFFRIQEHVRKCLPQLVETKHEVQDLQQKIQGASFDAEYGANAVKEMQKSSNHFESIQDLLKNAIFMKQQIDYEKSRRRSPDRELPAEVATAAATNTLRGTVYNRTTSINADSPVQPYFIDDQPSDTNLQTTSSGLRLDQTLVHCDSDATLKNEDMEEKNNNTHVGTEQKT